MFGLAQAINRCHVAPMPELAAEPARPDFATRFTRSNAADNARLAHEVRRRKARAAKVKPAEQPAKPVDTFISESVGSVRDEIRRIRGLMTACTDPSEVDKFASALSRLHDIERNLAGRPLPGSLRPTSSGKASNPLFGDQTPGV